MNLKVPKNKAIAILEKRKSEIYKPGFESKVWQGTVEEDLKAIFGFLDSRWLKVSQIRFDSNIESEKINVFETARKHASRFMDTFIEQIEEYSTIKEDAEIESEAVYKNKYRGSQQEIKQILNQLEEAIRIANENFQEVKKQDAEIIRLRNNTVQLEDITLKKLFNLLGNLPIKQIAVLISIVFGVLAFAGWLGALIEKGTNRSISVEIREEVQQLKKTNSDANETILDLKKTILEKDQTIEKLTETDSFK